MKSKHVRLLISILILILILTSLRLLWSGLFYIATEIDLYEGQLDAQALDLSEDDRFLLDGEWEFYPSAFIAEDFTSPNPSSEIISVPDGWEEILGSPFGYGSYRMQIEVDSNQDQTYALYLASIRSAYDVYVNGEHLVSSGITATNQQNYVAENLPNVVSFEADENGKIDIIIQVANYKDARDGGIIRSIMFGSEDAVRDIVQFSHYAQVILIVIFISHSLYALILYFLGNRDKRLFFFSLLTFCFTIYTFLSTGDKILDQYLYNNYDWTFKLTNAFGLLAWYSLLESTNHKKLPVWKKILPYYRVFILGLALITLFLPVAIITRAFEVYGGLIFIAIVVTAYSILRTGKQDNKINLLLALSFTGIIHHFIWTLVWVSLGIYVPYYPIDIILSVTLYLLVWFRRYFEIHKKTQALANRLLKVNQEKDEFLISTAHEFRTPLNSMLLFTEAIRTRENETISERSKKEIMTMSDVGRQMSFLLDDLLAMKQLENHLPKLNRQVIMIQPIIMGVLDMLQFSIEIKPFNVKNNIPEDFPAVYADEYRLTQIFLNLIDNAIKFTDSGKLTISATTKGKFAEISVSDTGIGISPEYQQQIFLPYEKGDHSKQEREGGFGLGLSIVKELVELHQGNITVESKKGQGTTFTVSLPLAAEGEKVKNFNQLIQNTTETKSVMQHEQLEDTDRPAVLIVDDNPASLMALQSTLPVEQYDTTPVQNAIIALEKIKQKEWDIVVSDIMMPEISGYQLTKKIREHYSLSELPVLLLSGGETDIQACFAAGANDYIQKPVEPVELKARLDYLIALKSGVEKQLELETAWLQAQIQPHFLFNTLNSIKALSEWDIETMQKLLDHLSRYLRSKFKFQDYQSLVPIEDELSLVRSYLYIEQIRFQDLLEIVWELDELDDVFIPFITIQPIVENAIHHGIRQKQGKGTITIRIQKDVSRAKVRIKISDDGVGIEQEKLEQLLKGNPGDESGVGILNVNKRLEQSYGTGLTIESLINKGTSVSFEIDLNKE